MADYREYRRRILRKRWRRTFAVAGLLVLLILLSAVGLLWKHLHREQSPAAVQGPTIFQQELQSSEWNTISYTPARRLTVQTTSAGSTAMDFRLAALDRTTAVDRSYFANVCFLGDSLTQGMQIYSSGLPEASFCAYRGANPSVVVNGTTCKRSDGGTEVPMEVLTARQPPVLYILLGTNVLNRDGDYSAAAVRKDAGGVPVRSGDSGRQCRYGEAQRCHEPSGGSDFCHTGRYQRSR